MRHLGRLPGIIFLIICLAILWGITHTYLLHSHLAGSILQWGKKIIYWPLDDLLKTKILTPVFGIAVVIILSFEWFLPAKPNQKIFSVSFVQDMIWLCYSAVLQAAIVVTYVAWLKAVYQTHFSFLTVHQLDQLPYWSRFLIGILIVDFLQWGQHWITHRVPFFWNFHVVHHSQKEINLFTAARYHVFEYLINHTFITFPLLIFSINTPQIVYFTIFHEWFIRFSHGNIKTNLGPLRYILVTPQSHRVHHSLEKAHWHKNYGAMFSIWDHLFGTQHRGYEDYPDTGVSDHEFPHEHAKGLINIIIMPLKQLLYSFYLNQKLLWHVAKSQKEIFNKNTEVIRRILHRSSGLLSNFIPHASIPRKK